MESSDLLMDRTVDSLTLKERDMDANDSARGKQLRILNSKPLYSQ